VQLDPQTGAIIWEYAGEEATISPPAFSPGGDVIYVVTRQQIGESFYEVAALRVEKRRLLWQPCFVLPAQWDRLQAPIVQEELLLVPLGEAVVVLRTTDGHFLSSREDSHPFMHSKGVWTNIAQTEYCELQREKDGHIINYWYYSGHSSPERYNLRYQRCMNRALPLWQHYREELNRAPLGHETWDY
jgi:hypothetical protein